MEGVDELDVEGFDGAEGPGVGLPVEVAQGEARDEAWFDKLVNVVRVEVLDWRAQVSGQRRAERTGGREDQPVTLEVEKGCSMVRKQLG